MTKSRRLTDAKGIIANLIRGPAQRRPKSGTPDQVRGDGEEESPRRGLASRVAAGKQRGMTRLRLLLAALFALALGIAGPVQAKVVVSFYSHDFGERFPHAFVTLKGRVDATGQAVDYNYGFTARSEEHTSELQSLMRISIAVFC